MADVLSSRKHFFVEVGEVFYSCDRLIGVYTYGPDYITHKFFETKVDSGWS